MPRPALRRCDVALWECDPSLLETARGAIRSKRTERAASLSVEVGVWFSRRVSVVRPPRYGASPMERSLKAFVSAHQPRLVLFVGAAAGVRDQTALGAVHLADAIVSGNDAPIPIAIDWLGTPAGEGSRLRTSPLGVGPFDPKAETSPPVTCRWAREAWHAAETAGVVAGFLAVTTELASPDAASIDPPRRWNDSTARKAGLLAGSLWRGRAGDFVRRRSVLKKTKGRVAVALGEIVDRLP